MHKTKDKINFAVITPLANEEDTFEEFSGSLKPVLDKLGSGKVYMVIDKASKDNTLLLCKKLSGKDKRFVTVWAPDNKNVVDAYLRGYKEALRGGHEYIIEMDGGLSHDPKYLPGFLKKLKKYECVFGCRFIKGGSHDASSVKRVFLSKYGTLVSNLFLGTRFLDMTSGYLGFHSRIVRLFTKYKFLSTAHFYQTELRYLLRNTNYVEIPIRYRATTSSISNKAIRNSLSVLMHYFGLRLTGKAIKLPNY